MFRVSANSEDALEFDIGDLSDIERGVPQDWIEADRERSHAEWVFRLEQQDRCAAEDADEGPSLSDPLAPIEIGTEDVNSPYVDWEQEQQDLKHRVEVEARKDYLRVDRDARMEFAIENGAFGLFDVSHVVDINDYGGAAATEYLIDHLLQEAAITMLFADGGVGKSFLILDWCLRVATGSSWDGRKVKAGRVLYVALEGLMTFPKRFAGWRAHTGIAVPKGAMEVYPKTVNMMDPTSVAALADYARAGKFALIVIDTLSRSVVGANENGTEEMGRFIASVTQIREAYEPSHLVVLHHSKKDDVEKYRGASVLWDGFDNVLCLRKKMIGTDPVSLADPHRVLLSQKTKDGLTPPPLNLIFEQVAGTGSAVLLRDVLAGVDSVVIHLADMLKGRDAKAGPVTRAALKRSLVTAGLYATEAIANSRLSTLIKNGVLDLDPATMQVTASILRRNA